MNTTTLAAFGPTFPCTAPVTVPWRDMVSHRGDLVRFARRKLHDPMLAEDVVHDVFEAVLSGRAAFAGRCALRSWLTAILKHKIVDLVRQRANTDSLDIDADDEGALAIPCPNSRCSATSSGREFGQGMASAPSSSTSISRLSVLTR